MFAIRSIAGTSTSTVGQAPARFVSVTNAPPVINLLQDVEFVFNTKLTSRTASTASPSTSAPKGEQKGLLLVTNFVADAVNLPLISAKNAGRRRAISASTCQGLDEQPHSQFPMAPTRRAMRTDRRPRHHPVRPGLSLMWPEATSRAAMIGRSER